jgi:hypothetical protein
VTVSGVPSRYEPAEQPEPNVARGVSEHSRAVALALSVVGGWFGLHRFYTGRIQSGICMCCTLGGLGIWYLYDIAMVAVGEFRDGDGRRVTRWEVADPGVGIAASGPERRVADVEDRMLALETQVNELAERLDFTERVLAQARERGSLPKA